jgi:hypothetical protein
VDAVGAHKHVHLGPGTAGEAGFDPAPAAAMPVSWCARWIRSAGTALASADNRSARCIW